MSVSLKALEQRKKYRDLFIDFARDCLTIRTKAGELSPLILNRAQCYLHEKLEDQKARTGKVRAIVVKGRQQGCSTYVEGRYYWHSVHRFGIRTFILAHDKASTSSIYEMAQRYHENCPSAIRPHTGTSNARELIFDILDSGYKIGTAGTDSVGRGTTLQYFHGSEVAYWPARSENEVSKGVLQAVGDLDDTEIILESTAKGVGGYFHSEVLKAIRGEGDYQLIFIPWFWQKEYRRAIPDDFQVTPEEKELEELYGLDDEQIEWRRNKIIELTTAIQDGGRAFKQEYPCTINEAFTATSTDSMISSDTVQRARKANVDPIGPLIVGVDPSRSSDRFSVARRRGRCITKVESHTGEFPLGRKVQICKKVLDEERPAKMFIDYGGGADLVDRLHELGYEDVVKAINFGSSPFNGERYRNKRCEMWGEMDEWLEDENAPPSIPDNDSLEADLTAPKAWYDSADRICMESKDAMKGRGLPSTDEGDACALTWAEPVRTRKRKELKYKKLSIA